MAHLWKQAYSRIVNFLSWLCTSKYQLWMETRVFNKLLCLSYLKLILWAIKFDFEY